MNLYDLDPAAQQAAVMQRLSAYLRDYVAPYHPFARRTAQDAGVDLGNIRSLEDFRRLPLMEKQHLQANPSLFVLQPKTAQSPPLPEGFGTAPLARSTQAKYAALAMMAGKTDPVYLVRRDSLKEKAKRIALQEWLPLHTHVSTGSSGMPTPVSYTTWDFKHVLSEMAALAIKAKIPHPEYLPFDWSERKLSVFPGAPHIAFYAPLISKLLVGSHSFETFGGAVIPTDRQLEIFARSEFTCILAIPSYLIHWLRRAIALQKEGRLGPLKRLSRAVLGAEPLSESLREYLRKLALEAGADPRMKVLQSFGMTEMKWTFLECCERSGVHLNPKFYFWELLHPETRKPVGPREPGVLVFTHIGWRGTVLIRYWTGDLVKGGMVWERCPFCGYTFPRIFPPVCRADKDFTKIKGTRVDLSLLREVVRDTAGVRQYQVVLANEDAEAEFSPEKIHIHLIAEQDVEQPVIETKLRERMKHYLEITPDRFVFEQDEPAFEKRLFAKSSVKAEHVVDRRKLTV